MLFNGKSIFNNFISNRNFFIICQNYLENFSKFRELIKVIFYVDIKLNTSIRYCHTLRINKTKTILAINIISAE